MHAKCSQMGEDNMFPRPNFLYPIFSLYNARFGLAKPAQFLLGGSADLLVLMPEAGMQKTKKIFKFSG